MSKLATPLSPPSSPSKSQPTKPSVIIPPSNAQTTDNPSALKVETTASLTTFNLASLTCATPLSTPHLESNPQKSLDPSNERDANEAAKSSAGIGISPDILAVGNLLSTMKSTLVTLSATFDFLGAHTVKAAALGPAIEATHQIRVLRAQLSEQITQQEARMNDIKVHLKNALSEQSDQLRAQMDAKIRETVEGQVKKRVEHQLRVQIPQNLREQVMQHKRQILEVQTKLHNSEARRYNATLHSQSCLTEPLRPLLRPLPTPLQSPCYQPRSMTVPPTPAVPQPPAPTPTLGKGGLGEGIGIELEPPTPSPYFPRDLTSLFSLNSDAARALVREYGLVEGDECSADGSPECASGKPDGGEADSSAGVQQIPTPVSTTAGDDGADLKCDSREKNLTRFMVHIGVPYKIIPDPNSTKRKRLAPLITTF